MLALAAVTLVGVVTSVALVTCARIGETVEQPLIHAGRRTSAPCPARVAGYSAALFAGLG